MIVALPYGHRDQGLKVSHRFPHTGNEVLVGNHEQITSMSSEEGESVKGSKPLCKHELQ